VEDIGSPFHTGPCPRKRAGHLRRTGT
jgi:hypothetical protein